MAAIIDLGSAVDGHVAEIVGRGAECTRIAALVNPPAPFALVIDGEAGIGKSRLWAFAVETAVARDMEVLSWTASHAEHGLAFAGLAGLLDRDLIGTLDALAAPRRRAIEIALGRIDPGAPPPEPGLVGLALVDIIRTLAANTALLIGLDDLQWCDPATEEALAFAARRLRSERVIFVLARRSGGRESQPGSLELTFPSDRSERISLGPLTIGALGRLVADRLGTAYPRPLLVRLHEACAGNPFVALEMGRALAARSSEPGPGEPFPVAAEGGPLVRDHLATLGRTARQALLTVALSSQPTPRLLQRVLGAEAIAAVDEAVEKGVIIAEGPRLKPAHPLFASIVYADAPPGVRRALRLTLAEGTDDPVERAVHLAAAVDEGDPSVVGVLEAAARTALQRGAPSVAADLFERSAGHAPEADLRATLLIEAASARVAAGDTDRAAAALRNLLASLPSGRRRAEALLLLGEIVYFDRPPDALPILVEALDHSDGDPILEATVHCYIGGMADSDPEVSYRSSMAAVEILTALGVDADRDLLACALLQRAYAWLLAAERFAEADIDRAIGLLSATGDSYVARRAREIAERCLFHAGRFREARALDEAEYARLADLGDVGRLPPLAQSLAIVEQLMGDWEGARRHARECLELVEQGEEVWRGRALLAQARVFAYDGDLDAARSMALEALAREEDAGDRWEGAIFEALLGFVELSVPNARAALGHLLRTEEYADAMGVVLPSTLRYLGDLVEAAVLVGDLDLAERVLSERLEAVASRIPLPWIVGITARARGLLARAHGDRALAVGLFDRSAEILDAVGIPLEHARTVLVRGETHLHAGRRRMGRTDIEAALGTFRRLGATAWARRAEADLRRISGKTSSRWSLTPSERSVADLAAAGQSNREIANQLVLSVRTVESHLASAYRKLGVRSRAQLVSALAREPEHGARPLDA